MSSLYWSRRVLRTSSSVMSLISHRSSLHGSLITHGYENVRINDLEIAGGKDGCWYSIVHLLISQVPPHIGSSGQYWEIVMCACEDFHKARTIVDHISMISKKVNS